MTAIALSPSALDVEIPPPAGTGHPGPKASEIRLWNEAAPQGGLLGCVVRAAPPAGRIPPGHRLLGYEAAIKQADGSFAYRRLLGNATVEETVATLSGPVETVGIETRLPVPHADGSRNKVWFRYLLWPTDGSLGQDDPPVRSEWSGIRKMRAGSGGAPWLSFFADVTDPVVGEAVRIRARLNGSDLLRPRHEAHFRAKLRGSVESWTIYDPNQENPWGQTRDESFGDLTVIAPSQTGPMIIDWTVTWRDASGALRITTGEQTLEARDPAEFFAAADTHYVDSAGLHGRGEAGWLTYTSAQAAIDAINAAGRPARLVLESDQTHAIASGSFGNGVSRVMIEGLVPASTLARIEGAAIGGGSIDHLICRRLRIVGTADTTDPTQAPGHDGIAGTGLARLSLFEVEIASCRTGIVLAQRGSARNALLDCRVTGAFDYSAFADRHSGTAIRGLWATQTVGALRAGQDESGTWDGMGETAAPFIADHGGAILAGESAGPFALSQVRIWNEASGAGASEPLLQIAGGGSRAGRPMYLGQIWGEGAGLSLDNAEPGTGPGAFSQDIVVDGLHLLLIGQPDAALLVGLGGTTLRNAVLIAQDTAEERANGGIQSVLRAAPRRDTGGPDNSDPIRFEHITCADLRGAANAASPLTLLAEAGAVAGQVEIQDILVHVPNRSAPGFGAISNLDDAKTWDPLRTNVQVATPPPGTMWADRPFALTPVAQPAFESDPTATGLFRPLPGSAAIAAAQPNGFVKDFFGNDRPAFGADLGAIQA